MFVCDYISCYYGNIQTKCSKTSGNFASNVSKFWYIYIHPVKTNCQNSIIYFYMKAKTHRNVMTPLKTNITSSPEMHLSKTPLYIVS